MDNIKIVIIVLLVTVLIILLMSPCVSRFIKSTEHFTNPEESQFTGSETGSETGSHSSEHIGQEGQDTPTIDFSQYVLKSSIKPCRDCRDVDPNYIHKKNMPPTCTVELANNKSDYVKKSSVPPCNCPPCPDCVCPPPPDVKVCSKLLEGSQETLTDSQSTGSQSTGSQSTGSQSTSSNQIEEERDQINDLERDIVSQDSTQRQSVLRQRNEIDRESRLNVDQQVNINRKINKTTSEDILPQERKQIDIIDGEEEIKEMSANVGNDELVSPDNSDRRGPGVEYRSRQMTPSEEEVDNTNMFSNESVNNGFCPEAMDTLGNTDYHAWGTQFT